MSGPDVHVWYLDEPNVELLLCDDCDALYLRAREDDDALTQLNALLNLVTPEQDEQFRAAQMLSEEQAAMYGCADHRHALCDHLWQPFAARYLADPGSES